MPHNTVTTEYLGIEIQVKAGDTDGFIAIVDKTHTFHADTLFNVMRKARAYIKDRVRNHQVIDNDKS